MSGWPWPYGPFPYGQNTGDSPVAEGLQDNRRIDPYNYTGLNVGHKRSPAAELPFVEWDPYIGRWRQGPQVLYGYKSNKFFSRPHDGKRPGSWGRFKDALTGEGADVFVTASGDKRTRMRDRPQRHQWTGWDLSQDEKDDRYLYDKDFRMQDTMPIREITKSGRAARNRRPKYDFNRRKFLSDGQILRDPVGVYRDAYWRPGARRDDASAYARRDMNGNHRHDVPPWAGLYPGGRPSV
jgi:hypothetical protein